MFVPAVNVVTVVGSLKIDIVPELPVIVEAFWNATVVFLMNVVPAEAPNNRFVLEPKAVTMYGSLRNVTVAPGLPVNAVALGNAIVAFLIAVVPVVEPMFMFVPAPNALTVANVALNNDNVPLPPTAENVGLAPLIFK
jgi:hypothetical protein